MTTYVPTTTGLSSSRADGDPLSRFELHSELGRGSMGVVYRAGVKGLALTVALRVIQDTVPPGTWSMRVHQAVPLLQSLNHPGVARLYDLKSSADRLVLVSEYVEGRSLRSWLDERGPLPLPIVLNLFEPALEAVGAAHQHQLL